MPPQLSPNAPDPWSTPVEHLAGPSQQAAPLDPWTAPIEAVAQTPLGNPASWGDTIADLVVDQLDPYNLALLGISFPVGGMFMRTASKLLGTEMIGHNAIRMATSALASGGKVATRGPVVPGATLLPELAQGLGFNLPFAAGELLEEPPAGSSRTREFMQSLAFNTVLDAGLIGAAVPLRFLGRAKREAQRTFQYSISKGASADRAAADAFLAKVEMLKAHGVPNELISAVVKQARDGVNQDTQQLLGTLLQAHGPAVMQQAQALGLAPEQVALGFKELIERSTAEAVVADMSERVAKEVLQKTSTDVRKRLLTDATFAQAVSKDLTAALEKQDAEAIERLVKAGFDRETLQTSGTPVVQAAREEMKAVLNEMVPPKIKLTPRTKPVAPEMRQKGFEAFTKATQAKP